MNFINRNHLLQLAKWSRMVAILNYFLSGMYILYFLFVLKRLFRLSNSVNDMGILLGFLNVYYLLGGVLLVLIFLYPNTRLYRFSGYLERSALENDEEMLNRALATLKLAFRFSAFSLTVIAIVAAIAGCWWLSVGI